MLRTPSPIFALAAVAILAAPAATATWMFAQSFEPSSSYDTDEWMWQAPPPPGAQQIYFAGFSQYLAALNDANFNPNVGALQTQIEVSNAEHHEAFLGIWIDCNGDGYIGMAESGVREYAAALLPSTEICPPATGPGNRWTAGAHNYNGWVSELVPIGRDASPVIDRRVYIDDETRVWADHERPDEAPYTRPCPVGPQPAGTYQSTGGFLNFIDCRVDVIGVANLVFQATGDPMGWTFADPDDARSGALGQIDTFGQEHDDNRVVTVWDCERQTRVGDELNKTPVGPLALPVLQPTVNTIHNHRIAAVSPSTHDTDDPLRGMAGQANHTNEGLMIAGGGRDCDTSNDNGHDLYRGTCEPAPYCVGEGNRVGSDPRNKRESHFNMGFTPGGRGQALLAGVSPLHGQSGIPADQGLTWGGSRWAAGSYWSTKPGFATLRVSLSDPDNASATLAPAYWLTFYAHVGAATLERGFALPGGEDVYGSWQCGGDFETPGIRNGWNCDPDTWYINADGSPYIPETPTELEREELARPGDPYELRDVDCYDGSIGDTGVGVQPAYYGPEPCH